IENVTLTGGADLDATGNALANTLTGNDGYNTLDGGIGADVLIGGAANDIYFVDNVGDRVIETAGGGSDLINATVSIDLTAKIFAGQEIENVTLQDALSKDGVTILPLNVTGNALDNVLTGNGGKNVLNGGLGDDQLL